MRRRNKVIATIAVVVWSVLLVPLAALAVLTDPELADQLGISDQVRVTLTQTVRPVLTDAVQVTETVAATLRKTFNSSLGDATTIGDQVVATLRALVRQSSTDAMTVTDQVTVSHSGAFRPSLTDSLAIQDAVSLQLRAAIRPVLTDRATILDRVALTRISAPAARVDDLTTAVTSAGLPAGATESLMVSLDAAEFALSTDRTTAACGQLAAFINKVQAQSAKAIPAAFADSLIATATQAERSIPCR